MLSAASWIVVFFLWSGQLLPHESEPLAEVDIAWGQKATMRDGVSLSVVVYRPRGNGPWPAVVTMTPYMADTYHERGMYFARHNFVFVAADCRGRGNSGGVFEPFMNDPKDGHDLVEWAAKQSWCNGKVGMWGGSYAGFNQWATLKEFPPSLKTIVPVASAHPGIDVPAQGGIMNSYWIRWLTFTGGLALSKNTFEDESYWLSKYRRRYLEHRPFRELDEIAGNPNKHFHTWLKQRNQESYWAPTVPGEKDYARMDLPILTITGHHDGDQPGALEFYQRHMKHGSAAGKRKHFLIIGPWDHAGTRTPKEEFAGLSFGKASLIDMNRLHREWYDWTLREGPPPPTLLQRMIYYTAGVERWRYVPGFDEIPATRRKYYLTSSGKANTVFQSGSLVEDPPEKSTPDQFTYDPLDTRPADLEKDKIEKQLTDQRFALNLFGNGLVYHSAPFTRETEFAGRFKFVAWISMDVPDTDFQVKVYEITREGGSILLGEDRLRARYRESLQQEKLVKPGTVNCYEFNRFFFNSRQLARGSRLRVVFNCINSIFYEKNYNSGGRVEDETRKDARTARITVQHDPEHRSYLEVPIIGPGI